MLHWVGGNTPCSDLPTDKSVSNLICVIRDARAFAEVVAAWSSKGLNQQAELKREWGVGQKRELRAPGCI